MNGLREMRDIVYYPWTSENYTDWVRIARVPDMEAALLAAGELADAVDKYGDEVCDFVTVASALAAFRNAIEVE